MKDTVALAVSIVCLCAATGWAAPPDPGAVGPYAIGHTSVLVIDTRDDESGVRGVRPIGLNVWYPLDADSVTSETPGAVYRLDPIYPDGAWAVPIPSFIWEHPCDNLPDPSLEATCRLRATAFLPTYEDAEPSQHGPFPLVVFSPGWNNRSIVYAFFAERLASHGFVVAVAQHYRDRFVSYDPLDPFAVAMYNRPRDVSFLLDSLLAMNGDVTHVLYNTMRPELVAVAGHSLGGYAALTLAGGDDEVCEEQTVAMPLPPVCTPIGAEPSLPDARFRAVLTLDAFNASLHFSELARVRVPAMSLGESVDAPGWQAFFPARQHAAIASHPNYRVDILGALHQSFTSSCSGVWVAYTAGLVSRDTVVQQSNQPQCASALLQGEVNRLAAKYAIAFLKTHLLGEPGYKDMLTTDWALTYESNVEFFVTEPKNATALPEDPTTFRYFLHPGVLSDPTPKDGLLASEWPDVPEP